MICQKCGKNNANYYYKQTVNGQTSELALCSDCANSMGIHFPVSSFFDYDIPDIFASDFLGGLFGTAPLRKTALPGIKKCSLCGSTIADISKTGKVGCAKCYDVFRDELESTIVSIHGRTVHNGRKPKGLR